MTTLIVPLSPGLAGRLERAAALLDMTREDAARVAIRLFTRSIAPTMCGGAAASVLKGHPDEGVE